MKRFSGVVLLLLLLAVTAVAQEPVVPGAGSTCWLGEGDNPTDLPQCLTPADNACYTGGVLEGQCGTTDFNDDGVVSVDESNWMWQYGWVLARVLSGDLRREDFPQFFPPAAAASATGGLAAPRTCFRSSTGFLGDILYRGATGLDNAFRFTSLNGTCTGGLAPDGILTLVAAPDATAALPICQALLPAFDEVNSLSSYAGLEGLWQCGID